MMFFVRRIDRDGYPSALIRKDAVRFVEPVHDDSIRIHVDGIGEIVTDTYDIEGFASLVMQIDADDLERVAA